MPRKTVTHFIPYDATRGLCGATGFHGNIPTCPACVRLMAKDDAAYQQLTQEFDPKAAVKNTSPAKSIVVTPTMQSGMTTAVTESQGILTTVLPTLQQEVAELAVEDEAGYRYADALLGRIQASKKGWLGVWNRVQEKTIKPIRAGLEELYSLNRDVEKPHDTLEGDVKEKMRQYKLREQRIIDEDNRAKEQAALQLRREAEAKERQAMAAATPQLRGRLESQSRKLEQQAADVELQPVTRAAQGHSSSTVPLKVLTITNLIEFLADCRDAGVDMSDVVVVHEPALQRKWKANPDIATFTGVAVLDDVRIVGR